MPLLEIQDLQVDFGTRRVVDGVSLSIDEGQTLCLVGESGCGKSVTALSIARLLPTPPARHAGGRILLQGRDVLAMSPAESSVSDRYARILRRGVEASASKIFSMGRW